MARKIYNILLAYWPHIFFLLLACSIIPIARGGFMFLLDDTFQYPHILINYATLGNQTFAPFLLLLKGINFVVPAWLLQRLLYIGCLYGLGVLGYKLASHYIDSKKNWIATIMGVFVVCNPFVYDRLIYGQLGVLISMMCLIGLLHTLLQYRRYLNNVYIAYAGIWAGVSIMWNVQAIFFVGLICLSFIIIFWRTFRKYMNNSLRHIAIFCIIVLCTNGVRLTSNFVGKDGLKEKAAAIGQQDYVLFATNDDGNIWLHQLLMHGFWKERYLSYAVPYIQQNQAMAIGALLGMIALGGMCYSVYKNSTNRLISCWICVVGIISFMLSMGIVGPVWRGAINRFLMNTIPFYDGIREPQKWLQLFVILFGLAYALGVYEIIKNLRPGKYIEYFLVLGFMVLPCLYVPQLFANAHGFMNVSDYPDAWYNLRSTLSQEYTYHPEELCHSKGCYDILVLPRHLYMSTSFSAKVINNPAEGFFTPLHVLQGDNIEIGSMYSQSTRKESKLVENYFGPAALESIKNRPTAFVENFGYIMHSMGIDYIVILKESNWKTTQEAIDLLVKNNQISMVTDNMSYLLYHVGER